MDFSELSKYSGLACFSPDGRLLATTEQNRIIVRHSETLQTLHSFACLDGVCAVSFAPDSTLIFGAQYKRKIVQVFSLKDPSWNAKIDEALAGLTYAQWAPDSRHIITRSEFNLRLSVWSLVRKSVTYIKQPKIMPPAPVENITGLGTASVATEAGNGNNVRFSNSGHFMAVLTRIECKDVLGIYSVAADAAAQSGGWDLLRQFHIDTEDCVQIEWSPDDAQILCVDSPLTYNIVVYTPSGQRVLQHRAYEHALGVKAGPGVKWSPSATFLAVGSYDQQLRVFNNATGQLMTAYTHSTQAVNLQGKKGGSLVLYAERPLNPSHVAAKLAAGASQEDKENNPLDDTALNFELANVSVMEGVAAPEDFDVSRSKVPGALKSLAAKKKLVSGGAGPVVTKGKIAPKAGASSSSSSSSLAAKKPGAATISSSTGGIRQEKPTLSIPSKYVIEDLPLQLTSMNPAVESADPKIGVGIVGWSTGDKYLVSRNDNHPNAVWVWDTQKLALTAVLTQMDAVRCIAWDPKRLRFALCTSTSKLYLWSPEGCSIVDVPLATGQAFQVRKLEWNAEGTCILLMDKTKFCCCYMRD
jgi:WD40 repeat protein